MTVAGFWSSDWISEAVPDEMKSKETGKPQFTDQRRMTYGGTMYQRLSMPAMELKKHGYDAFLSWKLEPAPDGHFRLLDTSGEWRDPDLVVLQRHMGQGMDQALLKARAAGQIIVNDIDDQFWALPKSNIAKDTTDPTNNPTFNRDHYRKCIEASSAITVSTDALRREFEGCGRPVFVIRNVVDLERWQQRDPARSDVISWIGGIQWRAADLPILKPIMQDFLSDYDLTFYHGGDSSVPGVPKAWEQLGLDKSTKIIAAPLVHLTEYPSLWDPVGIALVPLEKCRFNQAKSFLKSLEACACGLPYIVSDGLPEQRILIDEGSAGRLARNEKPITWRHHMEELLDPEVRRFEGKLNRAVAEKHDIHDSWTDWDDVYSQVAA